MKPKHIHIGHRYTVRINRKLRVVQVDNIQEKWDNVNDKKARRYLVTILETGEKLIIHNVSKFRRAVGLPRFNFELGKIVFSGENEK